MPSVTAVYQQNGKGENRRICSSVVAGPGVLVSTEHCFSNTQVRYVTTYGELNPEKMARMGEVVAFPIEDWVPALEMRRDIVPTGEPVAAIGYAWGAEKALIFTGLFQGRRHTLGNWRAAWKDDSRPINWHHATQFKGQSGGPVVDAKGRLISLVWLDRTNSAPGEILGGVPDQTHLQVLVDSVRIHGFETWPIKGRRDYSREDHD